LEREAKLSEPFCYEATGSHLLIRELGVLVEVPAPLDHRRHRLLHQGIEPLCPERDALEGLKVGEIQDSAYRGNR
jgi:hypothetical protein